MTTRTGSPLGAGAVRHRFASRAVVRLSGPDARRFCNGLFTNNVRDLPVGGAQRSAWVDDRGRLLGLMDLLCAADDAFVAVLDGPDPTAFVSHVDRYLVFDDVTLQDETGAGEAWTLQGPDAAAALARAGLPVPDPGRFAAVGDGLVYPSVRSPAGGYDLLGVEAAGALAAQEVDADALEVLRVACGRVRFPEDTGDKGLPHELGLRGVLAFDKGCYLGQESINRIDVMGQVKRALAGVEVDGGAPPVGAEVWVGEQKVGAVSSPVTLPGGAGLALAVLRKPADAPGTAVTLRAGDRILAGRVVALPHPL